MEFPYTNITRNVPRLPNSSAFLLRRGIFLDPSVLATISTLTPATLANPSSTQGFLMFIRHPELNSRDAISSSTRGKCHVLNPYLELNSRNTSKPTFEASLKHCRSRNQSKQPQLLPGFAWRNTLGAKCIRPPDRLAGAYHQALSASAYPDFDSFAWRDDPCRQAPRTPSPLYSDAIAWRSIACHQATYQ